jgi:hypothetical protein
MPDEIIQEGNTSMPRLIITLILLLLLTGSSQAQEDTELVGPLSFEQLLDLPGWFTAEALSYQPAATYLDRVPEFIDDVEIVCVLGTWCSDSRREVPRMFRLMQIKGIAPEKMRLIGVNSEKMSPGGETVDMDIERVPTFIFYRDGNEIGRIVESPFASLEKDMLGIIMQEPDATSVNSNEVPSPTGVNNSEVDETTQEKKGEGTLHEPEESIQPR